MPNFPTIVPDVWQRIDPDGGLLCMWSNWNPDPDDPEDTHKGVKLMSLTFMPCEPDEPCLCGSGKLFKACCQLKSYVQMICRDPGIETAFSPFKSQSAKFFQVDGATIREKLNADMRFICTEDTPQRSFWIYWGEPYIENEYGIFCFGDFELKNDKTLFITALSDRRMAILLDIAKELVGNVQPKRKVDPFPKTRKPGKRKKRKK